MRFPDPVVITRRSAADEYGNAGGGYGAPDADPVNGFLVKPDLLLLPAAVVPPDPRDRLEVHGELLEAVDVEEVRSPARTVLWTVTVKEAPRAR